jgi:hypothetical protein
MVLRIIDIEDHRYLESFPDFRIDPLEGLFHPSLNLLSLFAQVFELSEMLHPRSFPRGRFQFLLHRFGDQLSKGDAPFGSGRLGAPKQEIGNFKSSLHNPILPYLWESEPAPIC